MKIKIKHGIKIGDTRTINRFILFPKEFNGYIVWLETVKVKQVANRFIDMSSGSSYVSWEDVEIIVK